MRTHDSKAWLLLGCALLGRSAVAGEPVVTKLALPVEGQSCSALLMRPADAKALLVLAHGAQLNLASPFMVSISDALARRGIATLRFNFPYAEAGRATLDPMPVLIAAVRAALAEGARQRGTLPLLVGGKSVGGLVVAAAAAGGLDPAQGLVILGFPLHRPGHPSGVNAQLLEQVKLPMLFLEGTRDPLAELSLMRALVEKLGPRATLHVVYGADHQYELPPGSSRSAADVNDELADAIAAFVAKLGRSRGG